MLTLTLALAAAIYPEWSVLFTEPEFAAPERMVEAYLDNKTAAQSRHRDQVIAKITPQSLPAYRAETLARLQANLGAFPPRTPLNPRITGRLERDGYSIEKLIFESRPHFYVTANIYVPRGTGPFPGVICPVGHWGSGKFLEDYQRLGVDLARHGFVAVIYDGAGQGERLQYFNPVLGRSIVDPGTSEYYVTIEHWLAAGPNILGPDNFASYILWDGIRALDYLSERRDVDPHRLACTGVSGGGLQTELLAALDQRIRIAVPVCYGGCAMETPTRPGLSAADVDVLIAPRPLLMIEATGDNRADVLAKQQRHALVAGVYQRLNAAGNTRFFVAEGPHGYLESMRREAIAWLQHGTAPTSERPTPLEPEATLRATETGQVSTSLGGESVLTLTRADARSLPPSRPTVEAVRRRIGYQPSTAPLNPRVVARTATLEKVVFHSDEGLYVPGLLFQPATPGPHPAVIYVNEGPKQQIPPGLVESGAAVFSIDVAGFGETTPVTPSPYNQANYRGLTGETETDLFFAARTLGTSLAAIRVRDILRALDYLSTRPDIDPRRISLRGRGQGSLLVLLAAALDPRVQSVTADRPLYSFRALIDGDLYAHRFGAIIPGALRDFDVPDLVRLIAPRRVEILHPVDQLQRIVSPSEISQ